MTNATLRGKPDAGNPHVRFDEGEVASTKPRRGSLLYKSCFLVSVFGLFGLFAYGDPTTWHVDRADGDDVAAAADATGKTAFQSIQAAVNKAASGDTILVGPGVYDNVTGTDTKKSVNRVWISGKTLTLRSTEGAAMTHIVGRWDTSSASTNGCGAAQIRCICVNSDSLNTVIEGFTLRDGATKLERTATGALNEDIPQLGGGLAVYSSKKEVYLVDCVISNCTACWGGAMRGGTAVRCLITRNTAYNSPGGARQANLYSCVVVRNESNGAGSCGIAVNCTFAENETSACGFTTAYNCLYACGAAKSGAVTNCVVETSSGAQLFAPLEKDYRLLAGSAATTAGSATYLTTVLSGLPAGCAGKDFFGNPFPTTDGVTVVGAIVEQVTPLYGGIRFADKVVYQGEKVPYGGSYAFYNVWPQQVCVRPVLADGQTFFRYKVTGANTDYGAVSRWLQPDGTLWIVPPFKAGAVMTNTAVLASKVLWADANYTGNDSDGTEKKPYSTLADAVATVAGGIPTVIYAKEGDYNRGEVWMGSHSNRVAIADGKYILLKAVGRVEKTILRGKAASLECQQQPTYYPGCGTNAVRCLYLGTVTASSSAGAIQGFTLADGFANCNEYTTDDPHDRCGAIYGPSTSSYGLGQALDCVFTNCAAVRGGAFYGVWTSRCRMYDCHAYGGVTRYSALSSTYVDRSNEATGSTAIPGASANYVLGTSTLSVHLSLDWPSGAINRCGNNLVHLADVAQRWAFTSQVPFYGTVARDGGSGKTLYGATFGAPAFVDENHGDFRQLSTSCCAFGGGNFADDGRDAYDNAMSVYATYATTDMNGLPIRFNNGVPTPGAYQVPVAALTTTASSGSLSVNGSTAAATNALPATVTVRVENGTRPLVGFAVNDTEYAYDGSQDEWVFKASDYPADQTFAVTPRFGTNWYVNAAKPDNAGNGFTALTAKRTFHGTGGVMTNVREGDCVHADEGVYDEGSSVPTGFLRRRLVVPAGTTVVADKGPEKTFIVGARATESGVEGYEVDEWGRGTNAVACVYLKSTASKTAVVRGFTLTGGCTHYFYGQKADAGYWDDNTIGGAALALQSYDQALNGRVEDCIVSNNVSCRGGAFNAVNAVNCRVFGNVAISGGASANAFHQGCVVDRNRGGNALSNPRAVWNCTVGPNNVAYDGSSWTCGINGSYGKNGGVLNTLCLGYAQDVTNANNSIFLKHATRTTVDITDPRVVGCQLLEAGEMPVDAAYAPVIGANPAVDTGNPSLAAHDWYGDHDVYGRPRAVNGGLMDIGAVETDWCPRYSQDICRNRRFAVTAAGTTVVETAVGTVAIPDGETLAAKWVGKDVSAPYALIVRLSEPGTLSIRLNGELLQDVSAVGETTVRFENALAENRLDFVYVGEGAAEILSSRCECGSLLIVR